MTMRLSIYVLVALLMIMAGWQYALPREAEAQRTTFYAPEYCGNVTSSGEALDCGALTAAHPSLPFGTVVTVCHESCADVVVTDRGPTLDLTPTAANAIGLDLEGALDLPITVH